jgi:SAM-dependent methyltransferase
MPEPRATFDQVADTYDRERPRYPAALFDQLFSRLPAHPEVVEVGPGTGQATGSLLDLGARVTAVELGPRLAGRLGHNFPGRDELEIVVSSFEAVDLPRHAFDAVVSATAFHWITAPENLEKPSALLRPGGWLALIDTVQVDAPADRGFFERVQSIYDRYGESKGFVPAPAPEQATSRLWPDLEASPLYGETLLFRYRWDQTYRTSEYADLMRSYSNSQTMAERDREALIGEISQCIDQEFGGRVTRPLVMALTLARTSLAAPRAG